jgi:hypothetical protein
MLAVDAAALEREFERFKMQFRDRRGNHMEEADIEAFLNHPGTRDSFLRAVFRADPVLPDVQNIRRRLRGS